MLTGLSELSDPFLKMTKLTILTIVLIMAVFSSIRAVHIRPPAYVWSHSQLTTNSEKWIDYMESTTLGKLYNLFHDTKEVGLHLKDFDLIEPDPMDSFIPNDDLYTTQNVYKDTL